jgi:hypothetical protein
MRSELDMVNNLCLSAITLHCSCFGSNLKEEPVFQNDLIRNRMYHLFSTLIHVYRGFSSHPSLDSD